MRFKVGDKVIVKSFSQRPRHWSDKMNKWMGKIVTIRSGDRDVYLQYAIKEDIADNDGIGWGWKESDFLPVPKPGDRVKIRTWEDMEKQYGITDSGCIETPRSFIFKTMKICCGTITTVTNVYPDHTFFEGNDTDGHFWGFELIEEVNPKEEKMEFTKDMLRDGEHVVEYREGGRALYRKGCFVGPKSGTYAREYSDDLKNVWEGGDDRFDIVAVYEAISSVSFEYMLNRSDKLIWKRDEEPIEIPATEAFAKLKEIYGKEVKIVEDRDE